MFSPNVIGPAAYGAWQSMQNQHYRPSNGGSPSGGGDGGGVIGGLLVLALIVGVVIYFLF
jgi:hypothetical protein